jgi:hypothetical protein
VTVVALFDLSIGQSIGASLTAVAIVAAVKWPGKPWWMRWARAVVVGLVLWLVLSFVPGGDAGNPTTTVAEPGPTTDTGSTESTQTSPPPALPPAPILVALSELEDQGRVNTTGAELRSVAVGGESDPRGGYFDLGYGVESGEIVIVTNREFQFIGGSVGITADAMCRENEALVEVRAGNGRALWGPKAATSNAQPFRIPVTGLDQVVLYGRKTSPENPECDDTQIGWPSVQLIKSSG